MRVDDIIRHAVTAGRGECRESWFECQTHASRQIAARGISLDEKDITRLRGCGSEGERAGCDARRVLRARERDDGHRFSTTTRLSRPAAPAAATSTDVSLGTASEIASAAGGVIERVDVGDNSCAALDGLRPRQIQRQLPRTDSISRTRSPTRRPTGNWPGFTIAPVISEFAGSVGPLAICGTRDEGALGNSERSGTTGDSPIWSALSR